MKMRNLITYTCVALMAVSFAACSDSGSDPGKAEQSPSLPNLAYAQPETSYFGTSVPGKVSSVSSSLSFSQAQSLVLGFSSFSFIGQFYAGFLTNAQNTNAAFSNGVWEWEYNYSFEGESASLRTTAKETNTAINWNIFLSLNTSQVSFNDYNVMSGTTQNDGLEGEWTFNTFLEGSSGMPVLKSEWSAQSETNRELTTQVYDNQGAVVATITYTQTDNEHLLSINDTEDTSANVDIFWDTEANIGYLDEQGEDRRCWQGRGQSAADVACADVGL